MADIRHVIWTRSFCCAIEAERIAPYRYRVANFHAHVLFRFIAAHQRHPDNEYRDTQMSRMHTIVAARLRGKLRKQALLATALETMNKACDDTGNNPEGQKQTEAYERFPFTHHERHQQGCYHAHRKCPPQAHSEFRQACLLPARKGAKADQENGRGHQRYENGLEVGRADGYLAKLERIHEQGIEGTQENA